MSPQVIHPRAESTLHTPPNEADDLARHENTSAIIELEPMISVPSQPDLVSLDFDAQSQSLPPPTYAGHSKDLLHNKTPSCQFLDETPDLAFQTTEKDLNDKNSFLSQ